MAKHKKNKYGSSYGDLPPKKQTGTLVPAKFHGQLSKPKYTPRYQQGLKRLNEWSVLNGKPVEAFGLNPRHGTGPTFLVSLMQWSQCEWLESTPNATLLERLMLMERDFFELKACIELGKKIPLESQLVLSITAIAAKSGPEAAEKLSHPAPLYGDFLNAVFEARLRGLKDETLYWYTATRFTVTLL